MAHVRTQLRQEFKEVLEGVLPAAQYRIFASRKAPINHKATHATVDMRFLNDQTRQAETMDQQGDEARIHVPSLYIRVQRSATEETLDDLLDADEVIIVKAIAEHDWGYILEEEPELVQTNFSDDGSTGRILGAIVLRYDLEYRINKHDPEQTID